MIAERKRGSSYEVSLFCVPKAFDGHIGVIQRNALRSWRELGESCEILLLGSEAGVADAARAAGAVHLPDLLVDRDGFPRLDDAFRVAQRVGRAPWLCYVNADIILAPKFIEVARRAIARVGDSLIISRRRDLDITEPLDFGVGWAERVQAEARSNGALFTKFAI